MGIDGIVTVVVSTFVLVETRRNLARKSPSGVAVFDAFVAMDIFLRSNPPDQLVEEIALLIEPKDAAIVAGALAANCRMLVTFDHRHLLSEARQIEDLWGLHVETPGEFVKRFTSP